MYSTACCDIWSKFNLDDNKLLSNEHWTVLLRPKQITVGSCVLIANRHVESLSELSDAEARGLRDIAGGLEQLLKGKLQCDKVNYLALMMKDPHLHFHVIPRYATERTVAGETWKDVTWPKPPDMSISFGDPATIVEVRKYLSE